MAYRFGDPKSPSDGVPVEISKNLQPPQKITLPFNVEVGNASEIFFMHYDFTLEEKVIHEADTQREEAKEAERKRAEELEAARAREESSSPSEQDTSPDSETSQKSPEAENLDLDSESTQKPTVPPKPQPPVRPKQPIFATMGDGILVPTPFSHASGAAESSKSAADRQASFDPMVEGQAQDPFETAELKVINVMDELSKVLGTQGTQNKQPNGIVNKQEMADVVPASSQTSNQNVANRNVSIYSVPGLPDQYSVTNTLPRGKAFPDVKSLKDVDYPDPDQLSISGSSVSFSKNPRIQGQSVNPHGYNAIPRSTVTSVYPSYSHPTSGIYTQCQNNAPYPMSSTHVTQAQSNFPYSQSPQSSYAYPHSQADSSAASYNPIKRVPMWDQNGQYSSSAYNCGGAVSGYGATIGDTETSGGLRRGKSTPDISTVGLNDRLSPTPRKPPPPTSHTPPPYLPSKGPSANQPQAQEWLNNALASTNANQGQTNYTAPTNPNWNPYASYNQGNHHGPQVVNGKSVASSNGVQNKSQRPARPPPPSRLPDPYNDLSPENKRFTDSITDMGFKRGMVARAVMKFGKDDKKVTDHLFLINQIAEGGRDMDEVEVAVHSFGTTKERVLQYLEIHGQFKQLGFTPQKIQEALVKFDLNEDKALDFLTGA